MGKIIRSKDIDDMTIAFIVLGLTGMVFGGSMLYASLSCISYNISYGVGATPVMVDATILGSIFALNGLLLMGFCLRNIFHVLRKLKVDVLWGLAILSVTASAVDIIKNVIVQRTIFSVLVSLTALVASGIIFYMINYAKKRSDRKEILKMYTRDMLRKVS